MSSLDDLPMPSLDDPPDPSTMTLSEIYENLLAFGELILTIPADEEERLRKGLASVKAKANKRSLEEGMPLDKSTLSYNTSPNKDLPSAVDIHICLAVRNAITVLSMKQPDDEL